MLPSFQDNFNDLHRSHLVAYGLSISRSFAPSTHFGAILGSRATFILGINNIVFRSTSMSQSIEAPMVLGMVNREI